MTAEPTTQAEEIRAVFAGHPGSLREVTIACIDAGIFDPDRYEAFIRACQPKVQRALNSHDAQGLPFAGPSGKKREDGSQVWIARQLWDPDTYDYNLSARSKSLIGDYVTLAKLRDERIERYGEEGVPSIPGMTWDGYLDSEIDDEEPEQ